MNRTITHPTPPAANPAAQVAPVRPLDLAALVGAEGWGRLPAAVRRRFALAHATVVYEGRMDLQCSRIGRVFAALSCLFGGPLSTARAEGVATRVRVSHDACGGVVWARQFSRCSGSAARVVRSTKQCGPDGGLEEHTAGGLAMRLAVFEQAGALVFESRGYFMAIGRWRLPVPAWLTPGTCRVEHRNLGAGRFVFALTMTHPHWGETFRQTGIFQDPCAEE